MSLPLSFATVGIGVAAVGVAAASVASVVGLVGRSRTSSPGRHGARWARRKDVGPLVVQGREPGRLVLGGIAGRGDRCGRLVLAAERSQSVTVVGPTQSG
ncbi:MAG TPA: hypothetical protein VIJ60_03270, partial [Acidimicrobiales bacterium]